MNLTLSPSITFQRELLVPMTPWTPLKFYIKWKQIEIGEKKKQIKMPLQFLKELKWISLMFTMKLNVITIIGLSVRRTCATPPLCCPSKVCRRTGVGSGTTVMGQQAVACTFKTSLFEVHLHMCKTGFTFRQSLAQCRWSRGTLWRPWRTPEVHLPCSSVVPGGEGQPALMTFVNKFNMLKV